MQPSFRCNQLRLYGIQFSADTLYYVTIFRLWTPRFDFDHIECIYTGLSLIRSSLFSSRPATLISRAPVNIRYGTTFVPPVPSSRVFPIFFTIFFSLRVFFFFLLYIYIRVMLSHFTIARPPIALGCPIINSVNDDTRAYARFVCRYYSLCAKFRILHFFFFIIIIHDKPW